jgi:hypothetical protein
MTGNIMSAKMAEMEFPFQSHYKVRCRFYWVEWKSHVSQMADMEILFKDLIDPTISVSPPYFVFISAKTPFFLAFLCCACG